MTWHSGERVVGAFYKVRNKESRQVKKVVEGVEKRGGKKEKKEGRKDAMEREKRKGRRKNKINK